MPEYTLTLTSTLTVQAPYTTENYEIVRDEDWVGPLPQILEDGTPVNLTGKTLELFVRPTFGYATALVKLSTATGEIVLDDAANGLASIDYPREDVIEFMPAGRWQWFVVLTDTGQRIELWRGYFIVHPGEVTE